MGFWRKFQKDYGKEKVFFRSTKWIMERVKGFVCFCVGFKGFIKDYGKRKGKRKKLWKRMPTLGDKPITHLVFFSRSIRVEALS